MKNVKGDMKQVLDSHCQLLCVDTLVDIFWLCSVKSTGMDIDWSKFSVDVFNEVASNNYNNFIGSNTSMSLLDEVVVLSERAVSEDLYLSIERHAGQVIKDTYSKVLNMAEDMSDEMPLADRVAMASQLVLQEHVKVTDMKSEMVEDTFSKVRHMQHSFKMVFMDIIVAKAKVVMFGQGDHYSDIDMSSCKSNGEMGFEWRVG